VNGYEIYVSSDGANWGTAVSTGSMPANGQISFPGATGSYLKFRVTSCAEGAGYCYTSELNVSGSPVRAAASVTAASGGPAKTASVALPAAAPTPAILPQFKMTVVSATSDAAEANNVLDGNAGTRWLVNGLHTSAQSIIIKLGATFNVTGLNYTEGWTRVKGYSVFVSTDGVNWGTAVSSGTMPSTGQITFTAKPGAYIKFQINSAAGGAGYCYVSELNVVGY
jgi:endo-alpha-N-acetylgalactosaminidase